MSTILPRRVRPQPKPHLHPGGDCAACVMAGLLDIEVPALYELLETPDGEGITDIYRQREALNTLYYGGHLDRIVLEVPRWPVHELCRSWGSTSWTQALEWGSYILMALDAGYYGLSMVDYHKKGPFGDGTNHLVLICGYRERSEEGRIHQEILVSCSAAHPEGKWVSVREYLKLWGGFYTRLARPCATKPPPA